MSGRRSSLRSAYEVFTPTSHARVNFVERTSVTEALVSALRTPGKQVIVYGESGSGKSTLLENKLEQLYENHITTRCGSSTTFASVLADGFDKLNAFYVDERSSTKTRAKSVGIEAEFYRIRTSFERSGQDETASTERRAIPVQLTAQRLGEFMGARNLCWILEDFHKVPDPEKLLLAQALKTFSDVAGEYPSFKVIAIGAVDTARLVVAYDAEMANRVAEIHVPLMNDGELGAILDQGQDLLNVDFRNVRDRIIRYSVGVASVCHQLALNTCINRGINVTQPERVTFGEDELRSALERWVAESSDTLKARFAGALRRHRDSQYDNPRLILRALSTGALDGMRHAEILREVRRTEPKYPSGNLTLYLRELMEEDRGALIQASSDGTFRFTDPLFHTFAQAALGAPEPPHQPDDLYELVARYLGDLRNREAGLWQQWVVGRHQGRR